MMILGKICRESLILKLNKSLLVYKTLNRTIKISTRDQYLSSNNKLNDRTLINSINSEIIKNNIEQKNNTSNIVFYISSAIIAAIISFNTYKVFYMHEGVFVPYIISRSSIDRSSDFHYLEDQIQYQLLQKLSNNGLILQYFRLPLFLTNLQKYQVYQIEKNYSIKGFEITPSKSQHLPKIRRITKPVKFNDLLNPLSAPDIPRVEPDEKEYNFQITGQFTINEIGSIKFKGFLQNEHHNMIFFTNCELTIPSKNVKQTLFN
ncbi:hypothetical protein WICMUC_005455 [Wickerhamomyces mucosus]|uniref:Uncharacterized protein n=1 Tax=Wickerhamomyces mucosus TaxID=1378264 RepID=A0A9P8P7S0_9ASCO|nr:hypothetical protein WICMUC_005455 [Wickerhamomyces mucosus]